MPNRKRFLKRLLVLTLFASLSWICAGAQDQEQENGRRHASGYNAAVKGGTSFGSRQGKSSKGGGVRSATADSVAERSRDSGGIEALGGKGSYG